MRQKMGCYINNRILHFTSFEKPLFPAIAFLQSIWYDVT